MARSSTAERVSIHKVCDRVMRERDAARGQKIKIFGERRDFWLWLGASQTNERAYTKYVTE